MQAYPKFGIRKVVLLDGFWDFKFIPEVSLDEVEVSRLEFNDIMCVPGSFDAMPKYLNCRGVGCYRKQLNIEQPGRQELKFYGLGFSANIYINGEEIGKNDLTYSPFTVEFQAEKSGNYELIVVTDNRYDAVASPLMLHYYDFFGYGGIYRSVELHSVLECALQRVEVRMKNVYNGEITLAIRLAGEISEPLQCQIYFDDAAPQTCILAVKDQVALLNCRVPNFKLWSVEAPNLHTVTVRLPNDMITERFGLREIRAEKGQILLNNIPQKLRGYCRHESHIEFGVSVPPAVMLEDLQNLKMMGCNFIRGVHYPQDAAFWDLCDQLGFIVWSETLGWGNNEAQFDNPCFKSAQLRQAENM
ncbi:MAG: glycoside hydrolase family 2 TIM barrel-domain containing protein, partial [Victivallaceae bacterium]